MRTNQKVILVLLIIGLLFSSIIRVKFNLSNGFEYHGFWIRLLPIPIFDYAGGSNDPKLTSTIFGYLFYLVTGLMMLNNHKKIISWASVFIAIILISILFETAYMVQDFNQKFVGQHLRVGPFLFIIGFLIFYEDKIKRRRNG